MNTLEKIVTAATLITFSLATSIAGETKKPTPIFTFKAQNWNLIEYKGATVGYETIRRVMKEKYKHNKANNTNLSYKLKSAPNTKSTSASNYTTTPNQ